MDLTKKRAELLQAREQMLANLHAIAGALQLLDELETAEAASQALPAPAPANGHDPTA